MVYSVYFLDFLNKFRIHCFWNKTIVYTLWSHPLPIAYTLWLYYGYNTATYFEWFFCRPAASAYNTLNSLSIYGSGSIDFDPLSSSSGKQKDCQKAKKEIAVVSLIKESRQRGVGTEKEGSRKVEKTEKIDREDIKKTRRQFDFSPSSEDKPSYIVPYIDTHDDDIDLEDEVHCCILWGEGKTELGYQCFMWAHAACTGASRRPYKCNFCI